MDDVTSRRDALERITAERGALRSAMDALVDASVLHASLLPGVVFVQRCYIHRVQREPASAAGYCNLARSICRGSSVTLEDGRTLTQQQLYVEAVHCDPKNSNAYLNLGAVLPAGGSITLKDGRTLTQQQLFVEAVHCDPKNSNAYLNLGAVLPAGGSITLKDGRTLTKQQLLAGRA